jgi:hypothetical protein
VGLSDWLGILRFAQDRFKGGARRKRDHLKGRIVVAMRRAQSRNPAPLIFSPEGIAGMLDVPPSELVPALDELEREHRVFCDNRIGGCSLQPMPWPQPRSIL